MPLSPNGTHAQPRIQFNEHIEVDSLRLLAKHQRDRDIGYRCGGAPAKSLTTAARAPGPTFTAPANG